MSYNTSLHAHAHNLCEKQRIYQEALLEAEKAEREAELANIREHQAKEHVAKCLEDLHLAEAALYPAPSPAPAPPIHLPILEAELMVVEAELSEESDDGIENKEGSDESDESDGSDESDEEQNGKTIAQKRREQLPAKFKDVDGITLGCEVVLGKPNRKRAEKSKKSNVNYERREIANGLILAEVIQKWITDGCGTSKKLFQKCKDPEQAAWNSFLWEYGGGRLCFK